MKIISETLVSFQVSKRSDSDLQGRCDNNVKAIFPHQGSNVRAGDYCVVRIKEANAQVLKGTLVQSHATLQDFGKTNLNKVSVC